MKKYLKLSCLLLMLPFIMGVVMMFESCGYIAKSFSSDSLEVEEDTVLPLADTVYASVDQLEYEVMIADSTIDGKLESLKNLYDGKQGWFTFRGNPQRNAPFDGKITGTPSRIDVDWTFITENDQTRTSMGTWGGGTGWTGQPLYVHWTPEQIERFRKSSTALTADFGEEEIMVASLCGRLYFINYNTGKESRQSIDVTNPIKGTISLDPTMNGNLYIGQGIPKVRPVERIAINLFDHTRFFGSGKESNAWRAWEANDSSPIVVGGYLFWPSENGIIYKYKVAESKVVLQSMLRYRCKDRHTTLGVENSMCVYSNYGFFGDNGGNVLCINLNTMKPVWYYNIGDDVDASIVCNEENGVPYLYLACEVDLQGLTGNCNFVKLNALNGQLVWAQAIPCKKLNIRQKHFDGGLYSTLLLGKGNCEGMIFGNICQRDKSSIAEFTAFDCKTGNAIYRIPLATFAWSSPVAFYNEKKEMFVFAGDAHGNAYLIEAKTGKILFNQRMVNNFESSPVVIGNTLVVGSRGQEIYRFSIH